MSHNSESEIDSLTQTIVQIIKERKPNDIKQLVALRKERIQISEKQDLDKILELEGKVEKTCPPKASRNPPALHPTYKLAKPHGTGSQ